MKEENKEFFKQSILIDRVQHAMAQRGIDFDTLCDVLNQNVKYSITKSNLKLYISDRTPNANFLIALSRSLGVTTDFLLGENNKGLKRVLIKEFTVKVIENMPVNITCIFMEQSTVNRER